MHSGFHQIVLEGIKGESGFIALDDIEYTTGVNCDDQLVDPKPGEMHQWREQILKMDGLIHKDVLWRFKMGCYWVLHSAVVLVMFFSLVLTFIGVVPQSKNMPIRLIGEYNTYEWLRMMSLSYVHKFFQ